MPVKTTLTVQEVPVGIVAVVPDRAHAVLAVSATTEYPAGVAAGAAVRVKVTGVDDDRIFVRVMVCGGPAVPPLSTRVSDKGDTVGT